MKPTTYTHLHFILLFQASNYPFKMFPKITLLFCSSTSVGNSLRVPRVKHCGEAVLNHCCQVGCGNNCCKTLFLKKNALLFFCSLFLHSLDPARAKHKGTLPSSGHFRVLQKYIFACETSSVTSRATDKPKNSSCHCRSCVKQKLSFIHSFILNFVMLKVDKHIRCLLTKPLHSTESSLRALESAIANCEGSLLKSFWLTMKEKIYTKPGKCWI